MQPSLLDRRDCFVVQLDSVGLVLAADVSRHRSLKGMFKASDDEGQFSVTASSGGVEASTTVSVSKEEKKPEPTPEPAEQGLHWSGEVPAQKWMNFYTKVLAKFATKDGLKLTVKFDVSPEGGVSPQQADETRASLSEMPRS